MFSFESDVFSGSSGLSESTSFWVLFGIGVVLAGAQLVDVYADWTYRGHQLWLAMLENLIPTLLALALPYIGWRLLQRDSDSAHLRQVGKWTVIGCVGMILLSGLVMGLQVLDEAIEPLVVILQMATVGAIAGLWVGGNIGQVKEAEREMQDQRDRLANLLDGLPATVVHGKFKGDRLDVLNANASFEDVFGLEVEAVVGSDLYDMVVPEEEREEAQEIDRQAIEDGPVDREVRRLTKEGPRDFQLRVAQALDAGSSETYAIYTDITERKKRERTLRKRERQLEQIRENVTEVVWLSSPDKNTMDFISEAYEDIWGRSTKELAERPLSFVEEVHPEDRERVRAALELQQQDPEAYEETYRVLQPDGEIRWVHDKASGVYDENGQLERIVGVATDITERKRREQALQKRHEKMEALYGATKRLLRAETKKQVSVSILNLVNEVFGYPIVAVRFIEDGQFIPVQVSPEIPTHMPERPAFDVEGENVVAEAFRRGETSAFDDLRTFDGPYDYGEVRATAIVPIGEHGTISVADVEVGTIDDFDLRLIEILSTYTALVLDQLDREQELLEAKKQAEEASELKSAMLANMSHELRTPLTSITGFSEMLKERLERELELFATKIHKSSQRLQRTLESVLHLSKLEAGVHELEREEVSLGTIVEEVAETLSARTAGKSLTVTTEVTESSTLGYWNEDAIRGICRNLLENAIKFTPDGGRVDLRVSKEGKYAILEVEDTGIGMDPAQVPELFKAFKQESEGLDREYEGSGLGLPIVKRLVDELDGTIKVDTKKAKGTCFTVKLPLSSEVSLPPKTN